MNSLLHELIDFTRSGRKAWVFTSAPTNYDDFLHHEIEGLRSELAGSGVSLQFTSDCPEMWVKLDMKRLPRLLRNLVVNGVDAMGADGGAIEVRAFVEGNEVVTEITDSGPGIAPEIAARLFEPFATFGKEHGTGLGLSICQRIAEDHGGRIWARNGMKGGATFGFSLPKIEDSEP